MWQAASPRTPRPSASTTMKSSPSARPRRSKAPRIRTTNTESASRATSRASAGRLGDFSSKVKRGTSPRRPVFVAIGMGGNLENPRRAFRLAAQALYPFLRNPRTSPIYRTSPVGGPPQPDFLNAVLVGTTPLSADALLTLLRKSEVTAGREPGGPRNAPRPLDLDLLLYGTRRITTPTLRVPHPRMSQRLFVLIPLADVAPRRVVPGTGKTVAKLLAEARRDSTERVRPTRAFSRQPPADAIPPAARRPGRARSGRA
ncbi:MAG: 2-amino-4-hydroxy-6-hydroxymethyldihydropteridine diphosphokinase [Thermoanaerobaculia bacterium]